MEDRRANAHRERSVQTLYQTAARTWLLERAVVDRSTVRRDVPRDRLGAGTRLALIIIRHQAQRPGARCVKISAGALLKSKSKSSVCTAFGGSVRAGIHRVWVCVCNTGYMYPAVTRLSGARPVAAHARGARRRGSRDERACVRRANGPVRDMHLGHGPMTGAGLQVHEALKRKLVL